MDFNLMLVIDKYPVPKPYDLMTQLAGGQLGLSLAYQQGLLDEEPCKFGPLPLHLGYPLA